MKKKFLFLLAIVLLLPLFAACHSAPVQTPPFSETETAVTKSSVELRPVETRVVPNAWQGTSVTLPHEYLTSRDRHTVVDGHYYIHVTHRNADIPFLYYIISPEGDFVGYREVPLYAEDTKTGGEASYFGSAVRSEGIAVLESVVRRHPTTGAIETFEQSYLTAYDAGDRVIFRVDPNAMIEVRENPMTGSDADFTLRPERMLYGANGTLYLIMEYSVVAVGTAGEKLYETGPEYYINDAMVSADGRVLVQYTLVADRTSHWAYMDDGARGFSAPLDIPDPGVEEYTLVSGFGHDFYFSCADGLFFMDAGDAEPTLLCGWQENSIRYAEILYLYAANEDTVFVFTGMREWVDSIYKYALLKRPDSGADSTRKVITLGVSIANVPLDRYVEEFNRRSGEYYLVLQDMIQPWRDYKLTMEQQILEDPPDLIIGSMASTTNLASKGMFTDLYTYLDADPEFRDDLVSCILEPCEINGGLYHLAAGVQVWGFCGKADNLPEATEWTVETLMSLIESAGQNGQVAVGDTYRTQMQEMLIGDTLSTFVDFDNAVCDFENELFLSVLEYLKGVPQSRYTVYQREEMSMLYQRDEVLLDPNSYIRNFQDLMRLRAEFGDEKLVYLGIPSPEGGVPTIKTGSTSFSVLADSPVQDGAWEFIRYVIGEERMFFYGAGNPMFPVTKTNIRKQAERENDCYYVVSLDKLVPNPILWDGQNPPEYNEKQNFGISITEEDVEFILDILDSHGASVTIPAHKTVNSLIDEELGAYYSDSITAEEAARRIQSRVSIYLAEQAG